MPADTARIHGGKDEARRNLTVLYDGEIAAYCAAHQWPPEDLVATYLADEPMPRRAFRWRRPSVDALAFANAERCVHGFHARPSLRYVLARVARLVD